MLDRTFVGLSSVEIFVARLVENTDVGFIGDASLATASDGCSGHSSLPAPCDTVWV